MANELNKYFSTIGRTLAENLPSAPGYEQYLTSIFGVPMLFGSPSVAEIKNVAYNMKESAAGHYELPLFIFKEYFESLSCVLFHLFSLSLNTGIVPDDMKRAKVVFILKPGDPTNLTNYRPISILPTLSKILEKLGYLRVMSHLVHLGYLTTWQFGFRAQCSTEGAMQSLCATMYDSFDRGIFSMGIFLDLSKTFDSLDRDILLYKLSLYGIQGNELSWFKSCFTNRKQYVVCGGVTSSLLTVDQGTPQGSVLGLLLFLVYINDIIFSTQHMKHLLFADDTNLFLSYI